MIHKQRLNNRILSLVLALVMVLSMLPVTGLTAFAADTDADKAIALGTSVIADGDKANNKWDYVYYGNYNNSPIKWRVLSKNGNDATYKDNDGNFVTAPIFLLSEYTLNSIPFSTTGSKPNEWQSSHAQAWCKREIAVKSFSNAEKKYVLKTTKDDAAQNFFGRAWGASTLQDDQVFFISAKEALDYFRSNESLKANTYYWLRSPYASNFAGFVGTTGEVHYYSANNSLGARPAFNLDPSSVLFTSAAVGGKPDGFNSVGDYSGADWKLTLLDESRSEFNAEILKTSTKTVVSYSGAVTGKNEYISALIQDADGNVTYYGRLKNVANTADASGTVEIDLSGKMNSGDKLYIFNEQYNGDKMTDLAGELCEVTIPSEVNAYAVTFDANGGQINSGGLQCYKKGVKTTLPTDVEKTGYTFDGWYKNEDLTGSPVKEISETDTGNKTYYAKWIYKRKIVLGTSVIADGNKANNKWDYVYYGTYLDPIKWRVLSKNGNGGTYKNNDGNSVTAPIFLLSEYMLGGFYFERSMVDDGDGQSNFNEWQHSDAQAYCREIFSNSLFEDAEKKYVLKTTKNDAAETLYGRAWGTSELKDDTGFLISAREASDYLGSDNGDDGLIAEGFWCLRSPYSTGYVCSVNPSGIIDWFPAQSNFDARPAFNLDPSSVLFTSAAEGGKPDGFNSVGDYSGDEWKLTLKDDSRSSFSASVTSAVRTSAKVHRVTLSYSGAATDFKEYISAMICDANGTVTYYGRLKKVVNTFDAKGTVELDLSGVTMSATDTLYIFNEQYNGDKMTDYASELKAVTIPSGINAYEVTFDANGGTGAMNSAGVKPGETYTLPECTFTAPAGYEFEAWSVGSTKYAVGDNITISEETTVTALWKPQELTGTVTISGDMQFGSTLTATVTETNNTGELSYQWYRYAENNNTAITGATQATYTLTAEDVTYGIFCEVSSSVQTKSILSYASGTVKKKSISISGADNSITYDGSTYDAADMFTIDKNAGKATYTIVGGTGDGALNGSALTVTKVGTIVIKLTTASNDTCEAGEATATLTVQQKMISISWSNTEFTYDGSAHNPTATTNDFVLGDDVALSVSGEKTDAGVDYAASVTITGEDAGNYMFADGTVTTIRFTINQADQAALTVTGKPVGDIVYGDSFTLATEGGSGDGAVSWAITEGSQYAEVDELGGNVEITGVGTVKITVTKAESANYKAATATYEFTAVKATPDLGEVTVSGEIKDTTKPADVVLTRTNTTVPGTLEITDSAMLANKSEYNWKFTPDDTANYNTVTGTVQIDVLDTVAPTASIKVATNEWKEILNTITFGLFFKNTQDVTIACTDNENGSGIKDMLYYVADHELTDEELAAVEWETYNGTFSIDPDGKYVIYAKASDNDGNAVVINSDGIVLDETEAVVNGITNGETYYGPVVFTARDTLAGILSVEIDGIDKTHFEGQYVINPDNQEHTVVVTDKAGNKTEYKITVCEIYEIIFKHPTFDMKFPVNYGASFNEAHPDTVQDMIAEKDYHTFIGWYESTDGGETLKATPYDFDTEVTDNATLYPLFEINTYTVTYKADGKVVGTVEVEHGADAVAPAIPEKEGYTQTAPVWDKDGKNITADTVINAVYTINSYTITLDHPTYDSEILVNHGMSFNEMYPDIDANVNLAAEKDYHTFIGWYESTDGGETLKDTPYDFNTKVFGDITLYPMFKIYTYTVTYKADGEVVDVVMVEHGADATVPAIPEKEGYTQTAPTWDNDGKNITADTEINAVYTINEYTVTFIVDGETLTTKIVSHNADAEKPEIPAKTGYTAVWDKDGKAITADTTITAVYTVIKFTGTESTEKVEDITSENVKPEDKPDLEKAREDLEDALEGNYTDEVKEEIQKEIDRIDEALDVIDRVEKVEQQIENLPDTITKSDEAAVKAAEEAYNALTDYEKSLVSEDSKKALEDAVAALAELNKPQTPPTGDSFNFGLWTSVMVVSAIALAVLLIEQKKRKTSK